MVSLTGFGMLPIIRVAPIRTWIGAPKGAWTRGIAEQVAHDLSQSVRAPVSSTTSSSSEPLGSGKGGQVDQMACRGRASGPAAQVCATAARFVTGFGALCRLPDITRWAQTVAALPEPGGFLYLAEYHPFADALAEELPGRRRHRLPEEACAVTAAE